MRLECPYRDQVMRTLLLIVGLISVLVLALVPERPIEPALRRSASSEAVRAEAGPKSAMLVRHAVDVPESLDVPSRQRTVIVRSVTGPVESAELYRVENPARLGSAPPARVGRTDASGECVVQVDSGRFLGVRFSGYVPFLSEWEALPVDAAGRLCVMLTPGHSLVVHVESTALQPIRDARVRMSTQNLTEIAGLPGAPSPFGEHGIHEASTDPRGMARFDCLAAGRYYVSLDARWYVPHNLSGGMPVVPGPQCELQMAPVLGDVFQAIDGEILSIEVQRVAPRASVHSTAHARESAWAFLTRKFPDHLIAVAPTPSAEVTLWILGRTTGWTSRAHRLRPIAEIHAPTVLRVAPGNAGQLTGYVVLDCDDTDFALPLQVQKPQPHRTVADVLKFPAEPEVSIELPEGRYELVPVPSIPRKRLGALATFEVIRGRTTRVLVDSTEKYRKIRLAPHHDGEPINSINVRVNIGEEDFGTLYGVRPSDQTLHLPVDVPIVLSVQRFNGNWHSLPMTLARDPETAQFVLDLSK